MLGIPSYFRQLRPLPAGGQVVAAVLFDTEGGSGMTLNALAESCGFTRAQTGLALSISEERGWLCSRNGVWRLTPSGRATYEADSVTYEPGTPVSP